MRINWQAPLNRDLKMWVTCLGSDVRRDVVGLSTLTAGVPLSSAGNDSHRRGMKFTGDTAGQVAKYTFTETIYELTVAFWFRVDAFDINWQCVVGQGEHTDEWRIARYPGSNVLNFVGRGAGSGLSYATEVNDGKWHYATMTHSAADEIRVFLDGVSDASLGSYTLGAAAAQDKVWIGDNPDAAGRLWEGAAADLRVYNRALSQLEVWRLYLASKTGYKLELMPKRKRTYKAPAAAAGRIMGGLVGEGGLVGPGGLIGQRGGLTA